MEPSSSTTSRKRALSMSDLCESDGKKANNTSVDTGSQLPNMPHATAAHTINTIITGMSRDLQGGLFHGAHNFVVTGSQFTEIVNNYHCPTSVVPTDALRPLRPWDPRNIDRHTIGKLINAVTARYPSTSNSDAPLAALLKVLQEKGPGEHVMSVIHLSTVDFMIYLLSMHDYAKIPSKVDNKMDALGLVDLIFYLLDHDLLRVTKSREGNHRARRLMIKLGLKVNAVPQSALIHKDDVKIMGGNLPMESGAVSNVHQGSYRGNQVAIKRLSCPGHRDQKPFIREVFTWRSLSHDYVLPYVGTYEDFGFMYLVSPFMENRTLSYWRNERNSSAPEVEKMILQVAEGVQYLHYEGIIHCNLRGTNVMLDSNLQVRICGFNLCRDSNAAATDDKSMSIRFAAPELLVDEDKIRFTKKTDIYAFGCLYYEIHFNLLPFGNNPFDAVQQVKYGKRPPRKPNPPMEDEAWNLIERCWDQDPIKRSSIVDVVDIMISWRRKGSDCESEWDSDNSLEGDDF